MKVRNDVTVGNLFERFPNGFVVSPGGAVYEVKEAFRNLEDVVHDSKANGYLIVVKPKRESGDVFYGQEAVVGKTVDETLDAVDEIIRASDTPEEDALTFGIYKEMKKNDAEDFDPES